MDRIPIGELCRVFDGPHATPVKTTDGPIYLGIDAITDDGKLNSSQYAHLSENDYIKWTKRVTPIENDIVFSYEATLGRYAMIPQDFYGCLGRRLAIIRTVSNHVNPKWLYYYFRSPEWTAFIESKIVKGSTVNRISVEDFPDYTIPVVDRKTQDRIVDVLSALDKKIDLNAAINDNLQQQVKLLYDYWFTQFDFPDENGNPYRTSGGKMVWNDMYGEQIPAYWRVVKLSECIERIATGLNPRDNFKLGTGSIKYITVKNLTTNGQLDLSGCDTVDAAAREVIHKRSDIKIGDILFASISPLGRCYYITSEPDDWDINESVFSIRADNEKISPEYLYEFLSGDRFIKQAEANSTGSIFKGIRINTLLDTPIVLPPHKTVMQFSNEIHTLFMLQDKYNSENQKLVTMRDWLLPMLMNGQATIAD